MELLFKLSHFRDFFRAANVFKKLGQTEAENIMADRKGGISGTFNGYSHYYEQSITFKITAVQDWYALQGDIQYFIIEWTSPKSGKERSEWIFLHRANSNLIEGSHVVYFVCPHTGRSCRKLYTEGEAIACREAFTNRYPSQNRSHKEREIAPYRDADSTDPQRKYGKETYRGKLTPYGRRLQRWEEKVEASSEAWYRYVFAIVGRKFPI